MDVIWNHIYTVILQKTFALYSITIFEISSFISIISTAFISSFVLGSYNDGYLLLAIELLFMVGCMMHQPSYSPKILINDIKESLVISVIAISLLALVAQLMIAFNIEPCASFAMYHPWQDIHCVPFSGLTIYRLSIGSNINEFSLYLSMAIIVLLFWLSLIHI